MKEFYLDVPVISVNGYQTWKALAATKEEALKIIKVGNGEFVAEELDVNDTDMRMMTTGDLYEQ